MCIYMYTYFILHAIELIYILIHIYSTCWDAPVTGDRLTESPRSCQWKRKSKLRKKLLTHRKVWISKCLQSKFQHLFWQFENWTVFPKGTWSKDEAIFCSRFFSFVFEGGEGRGSLSWGRFQPDRWMLLFVKLNFNPLVGRNGKVFVPFGGWIFWGWTDFLTCESACTSDSCPSWFKTWNV